MRANRYYGWDGWAIAHDSWWMLQMVKVDQNVHLEMHKINMQEG